MPKSLQQRLEKEFVLKIVLMYCMHTSCVMSSTNRLMFQIITKNWILFFNGNLSSYTNIVLLLWSRLLYSLISQYWKIASEVPARFDFFPLCPCTSILFSFMPAWLWLFEEKPWKLNLDRRVGQLADGHGGPFGFQIHIL